MHRYCKQVCAFALGLTVLVLPGGLVGLLLLYAVLRGRENSALSRVLNHAIHEIGPVVRALRSTRAWLRRAGPLLTPVPTVRARPNPKPT